MRLVFVNHTHPDVPHVSGRRVGCFARAMALRGHHVVLLACAVPGSASLNPIGSRLSAQLAEHDWRQPLIVAIPPVRRRWLNLARENGVPNVLRRALTLGQFVVHGGMFADWQTAAQDATAQLAAEFRPDAVWGTFGNTTNLTIAQGLARRARCPWVLDVKDNWAAFIPKLLRTPMAWRFRDAAGLTGNSQHHMRVALRWLPHRRAEVIYSGVADDFFKLSHAANDTERSNVLLVGSTYDEDRLRTYLSAVREWMEDLPLSERESVKFVYAGSDDRRVAAALKEVRLPCSVTVEQQLTVAQLAAVATRSFANSYIWAPVTFHQKLLELLVCGRPLICYPGESAESKALASQVDSMFAPCETSAEVRGALASAWAQRKDGDVSEDAPAWRWADFAASLDQFFQRCIQARQT